MKKYLLLIISVILLGCQETHYPAKPMLGEEVVINFGQQITFPGEAVTLTFRNILEDSRCPEGVTCVWAGNAKIAIQLNSQETNLNTYLEPKVADFSEYHIELISLDPYPVYKKEIRDEEYVAKLEVTRN